MILKISLHCLFIQISHSNQTIWYNFTPYEHNQIFHVIPHTWTEVEADVLNGYFLWRRCNSQRACELKVRPFLLMWLVACEMLNWVRRPCKCREWVNTEQILNPPSAAQLTSMSLATCSFDSAAWFWKQQVCSLSLKVDDCALINPPPPCIVVSEPVFPKVGM